MVSLRAFLCSSPKSHQLLPTRLPLPLPLPPFHFTFYVFLCLSLPAPLLVVRKRLIFSWVCADQPPRFSLLCMFNVCSVSECVTSFLDYYWPRTDRHTNRACDQLFQMDPRFIFIKLKSTLLTLSDPVWPSLLFVVQFIRLKSVKFVQPSLELNKKPLPVSFAHLWIFRMYFRTYLKLFCSLVSWTAATREVTLTKKTLNFFQSYEKADSISVPPSFSYDFESQAFLDFHQNLTFLAEILLSVRIFSPLLFDCHFQSQSLGFASSTTSFVWTCCKGLCKPLFMHAIKCLGVPTTRKSKWLNHKHLLDPSRVSLFVFDSTFPSISLLPMHISYFHVYMCCFLCLMIDHKSCVKMANIVHIFFFFSSLIWIAPVLVIDRRWSQYDRLYKRTKNSILFPPPNHHHIHICHYCQH